MNYSNDTFCGEDIDWFSIDIEDKIAFFASGGGAVPCSIDPKGNELLSHYFRTLPEIKDNELFISPRLGDFRKFDSNLQKERYLEDFIFMAKRGMYAYDKTELGNFLDPLYHLVVAPSIKLSSHDLPEEIYDKLRETKCSGTFKDALAINLSTLSHRRACYFFLSTEIQMKEKTIS